MTEKEAPTISNKVMPVVDNKATVAPELVTVTLLRDTLVNGEVLAGWTTIDIKPEDKKSYMWLIACENCPDWCVNCI